MSKTYDLLSQCFVNPHDHLGATKWNCQDPTCGHLKYTGSDHFHLGYFPLSRELGVLKERFVKNVDECAELGFIEQVGSDNSIANLPDGSPCLVYHCTACNRLVCSDLASITRHCDTLEHRDRISRLIKGQDSVLEPTIYPGYNSPLTECETWELLQDLGYEPSCFKSSDNTDTLDLEKMGEEFMTGLDKLEAMLAEQGDGLDPKLDTALRRLVDISKGFETAIGSLSASVRLA